MSAKGCWLSAASVPVPAPTESSILLINDKDDDPDREDNKANRPKNDADLDGVVQDQQDHTKHGVLLHRFPYPEVAGSSKQQAPAEAIEVSALVVWLITDPLLGNDITPQGARLAAINAHYAGPW
jgi:hypothetical protein